MGLLSNLFSDQFIDIIRWDNPSPELLVKKWDQNLDEIKNKSSLMVDPGLAAIFVHNGKIEAIQTESGKWTLETSNTPFVSSLKNFMSGFETHNKGQIYFLKTNEITNLKWGTPNAITYIDPVYDFPVELRTFGNFTFRITDIENFWVNYVANRDTVAVNDIRSIIVDRIIGTISSILAQKSISYNEIDKHAISIAKELLEATKEDFAKLGLTLSDFRIEDTNFTEKTQGFIDRITSKGADVVAINKTKNIDAEAMTNYTKIEQLNIANKAAESGGVMGDMMDAGVGMAMGAQMANTFGTPAQKLVESPEDTLLKLKSFLEKGLITQADFDAKKKDILSNI
ncbi:hypothetical protein AUK10_04190 [Candidatus Gracilibacteria bacterium CG2_30_37_12]|nr:MAG: hypothetical protein AUK10_04190 [Candidatus Gracilibacteria bacterium CG2_30_37_12]